MDIPLFAGYLFARIGDSPADRLRVVQSRGVVRILGNGSVIQPVPDEEIDSIRGLLRSGKPFLAYPFTSIGARVRIRRGVLAGVEGRLVRIRNKARVVLSVDLLSQAVATDVDYRDVELISVNTPETPKSIHRS